MPLLILCTARPELLERRTGWGGGKANALTISLPPLSDDDTASVVAAVSDHRVPAEIQAAVLERAEGNPLYAEQFARALAETGALVELPETVHGIIAARLDALSPDEKELLQDGAVVGKVFWVGALEAIGGVSRQRADELLHSLERKEFVHGARQPSIAREAEYMFRHVLLRDVAYGQIRVWRVRRSIARQRDGSSASPKPGSRTMQRSSLTTTHWRWSSSARPDLTRRRGSSRRRRAGSSCWPATEPSLWTPHHPTSTTAKHSSCSPPATPNARPF